jgi:antirestriction protein ArdC
MSIEKQDVYTRITNKIIADLEQGVRTWMKPWNAGNTAGRITRPLRHNGVALFRHQHPDALGGGRRTRASPLPSG